MSQAESDWKKLKEWSTMYRDYLYQHTPFRTFMRSRDSTEEEKFESIDSLISQLFLVDNFKDFKRSTTPSNRTRELSLRLTLDFTARARLLLKLGPVR